MGSLPVIVLDTHALVWWVGGDSNLSDSAARRIQQEQEKKGSILISSISAWEIAQLVERGRLLLSMDVSDWMDLVAQIPAVAFVAVENEIAIKSVSLPGEFHKDPADRIIVATARKFAAPLITKDEKILAYPHVKTLW
jgi:PIN domain nuclease of toxin-antitoxin system